MARAGLGRSGQGWAGLRRVCSGRSPRFGPVWPGLARVGRGWIGLCGVGGEVGLGQAWPPRLGQAGTAGLGLEPGWVGRFGRGRLRAGLSLGAAPFEARTSPLSSSQARGGRARRKSGAPNGLIIDARYFFLEGGFGPRPKPAQTRGFGRVAARSALQGDGANDRGWAAPPPATRFLFAGPAPGRRRWAERRFWAALDRPRDRLSPNSAGFVSPSAPRGSLRVGAAPAPFALLLFLIYLDV